MLCKKCVCSHQGSSNPVEFWTEKSEDSASVYLVLCKRTSFKLRMGGVLQKGESPKASIPQTKLEAKITEAMRRRESEGSSMKSCNSVILKFPKIDESLRKCKATFQDFDEDGNDTIDPQELKHCFRKLEMNFLDEEINNLFEARNINADMGLKFNEFIVLLCLVYLLKDDPAALHAVS